MQVHESPTLAAGKPSINTARKSPNTGPPTWGTGGVPGVTFGHICSSPIRAAGLPKLCNLID